MDKPKIENTKQTDNKGTPKPGQPPTPPDQGELSEEDLEGVAGGMKVSIPPPPPSTSGGI